jgi:hypothetical protein
MANVASPNVVNTYTHFLQRHPLYEEEKPYSLRFTAPEGFARANIKLDKHELHVHDVRSRIGELSLEKDGCYLWKLHSKLTYGDFDNDEMVRKSYLPQVADGLCVMLGASKVQVFEHTVSAATDQ